MTLLLSFIETVTWYHQYQRPVKRDSHGAPYVETTLEDIRETFLLLKEVLFSKSNKLAIPASDAYWRENNYYILGKNRFDSLLNTGGIIFK